MAIMDFTQTVIKNLFSKPATKMYPFVPRAYPERTRGHVCIDAQACVYCGLCGRNCPANAITVDRTAKRWSIERFSCVQCGYCVETCPKKCLSMAQTYTQPAEVKTVDAYQAEQ